MMQLVLHTMSELSTFCEQAVSSSAFEAVVSNALQKTVERMTRGRTTASVLHSAQNYVGKVILPFLQMLLGEDQVAISSPAL